MWSWTFVCWERWFFCLFVFCFFLTDPISLLEISLFIFYIASWVSLGRVYISKNLSISPRLTVYWRIFFYTNLLVSYLFFCHLSGYSCFIYDFIDLGPLYFSSCFWLIVVILLFGACPFGVWISTISLLYTAYFSHCNSLFVSLVVEDTFF